MSIRNAVVRLEANQRFRRAALRFWPTRGIARRRATRLFDLCAGFVYSQVLASVVRLDVARRLLEEPCEAASLAPKLGLDVEAADRLLRAAAAIGIARRERDRPGRATRYGLGPMGAALIDNEGVLGMIRHHALLYDDLADPVALLRGVAGVTRLQRFWDYGRTDGAGADGAVDYTDLMSASQLMLSDVVLDAYPFHRHQSVLDVGGGDGTFLRALASRSPFASMTLFDLSPVAELAGARCAALPNGARINIVAGDVRRDALPLGSDLVTFVRVLHDHDDDTVMAMLATVRRSLAPGGRILIAEPMAETRGALAAGDAYFGFYLLAMRGRAEGSGRPRSARRLRAMLKDCGFHGPRLHPTAVPMLVQVMTARA